MRAARTLALGLLAAAATAVVAAPPAAAEARAEIVEPGQWLRGGTGADTAWLLVADEPEAPRQLLELRWREARAGSVASGLPKELAGVVVGGDGEVLLTGGGTVLAVDAASGATRRVAGAAQLVAGDGDTFAAAPPWLADARLGEARAVRLAGGAAETLATQPLPIAAEREPWGLRLSSPPVSFAGDWLVVGPRQEGRRVQAVLLGPAGERREQVGVLPEPEQIADRAVVVVDGRPLLVLGTFRGLGIASKKRLRVFPLDGRGGTSGAAPLLARELPGRVWHALAVRGGDLDGDGNDDLTIATAEGFSGDTVHFTVFPGQGGGRLGAKPVTASVGIGDEARWRYGDVTGDGRADLVTLRDGKLALYAADAATGLPGKRVTSTHALGSARAAGREVVEVSVGSRGSRVERRSEDAAASGEAAAAEGVASAEGEAAAAAAVADDDDDEDAAGTKGFELVDLDGDGALEVVRWEPAPERRTRLTILGLRR